MNSPDPFGCVAELRAALSHKELDEFDRDCEPSPGAVRYAYFVAVALGKCRLFNVAVGEIDGTLPLPWAMAACNELVRFLQRWSAELADLRQRWEQALSEMELDDLCAYPLECRMDAWAALLAIDEAFVAHETNVGPVPAEFDGSLKQVVLGLDEFDEALQAETDTLCMISHLPLLDNWRTMLKDSPFTIGGWPWWLDGTLERASQEFAVIDPILPGFDLAEALRRKMALKPVPATLTRSQLQIALNECYASAADQQQTTVGPVLVWDHPRHEFFAQLEFPSGVRLDPSQEISVQFFWGESQPDRYGDSAFGFSSVRLGAIDGKIAADGSTASFKIDEIQGQDSDALPLEVDGVQWQFRATSQ